MKAQKFIVFILLFSPFTFSLKAEEPASTLFSGQLSGWLNSSFYEDLSFTGGIRYLPELSYSKPLSGTKFLDIEISANIYGTAGLNSSDRVSTGGRIKPYRMWARYATTQLDLRAGLQKINFGSASILRPLMWFDRMDPRDPLQVTDGVWGVLGRYFFPGNTNIWIWGLWGNNDPKGWEIMGSVTDFPETGGRIQFPVPYGETALTWHFRKARTGNTDLITTPAKEVAERRIAVDGKWDVTIGLWIEGVWTNMDGDMGVLANSHILNTGADYTFAVGNGIHLMYEHLLISAGENPFSFSDKSSFSALSASYPLGILDNMNFILFYDWRNSASYNFLSWQRQWDDLTLFLMGYVNPSDYNIPLHEGENNIFSGRGIQFMLVWNH